MIRYTLTQEMIDRALEHDRKINEKDYMKLPCYTGFVRPDRYFVGTVGEYALHYFFKENRIKHIFTLESEDWAHETDFYVWRQAIRRVLDIKTAGEPWHKKMMMPLPQFERYHGVDYYLGAKMLGEIKAGDEIGFYGACKRDLFQKDESQKIAAVSCALADLYPMSLFINLLDRETEDGR